MGNFAESLELVATYVLGILLLITLILAILYMLSMVWNIALALIDKNKNRGFAHYFSKLH